jgi:hypothetical protein
LAQAFRISPSDEGLSQADLIGYDYTAEILQDAACAPDAVQLEGRQWDVAFLLPFLLELLAVQLPQDAQED